MFQDIKYCNHIMVVRDQLFCLNISPLDLGPKGVFDAINGVLGNIYACYIEVSFRQFEKFALATANFQ